tara:strand:+ start:11193 stop:12125 length:933 start_codon:yes stop_codon:yes gene_type:complete
MRFGLAPKFNEKNMKRLAQRLNRTRTGTHVSDICNGLTKAYYRKVAPLPHLKKSLMNFTRGRAIEEYITLMCKETGVIVEVDGIIGTMDGITQNDAPVEGKTTNKGSKGFLAQTLPVAGENYVDQLRSYCALRGKSYGFISVFFLYDPILLTWKVSFEEEELEDWLVTLHKRKEVLEAAWNTLTPPPPQFCPRYAWECSFCEFNENNDTILPEDKPLHERYLAQYTCDCEERRVLSLAQTYADGNKGVVEEGKLEKMYCDTLGRYVKKDEKVRRFNGALCNIYEKRWIKTIKGKDHFFTIRPEFRRKAGE